MTDVVIHGDFERRDSIARALLRHFGFPYDGPDATHTHDIHEARTTVPLGGVSERDVDAACWLYVMPHGLLHFVQTPEVARA